MRALLLHVLVTAIFVTQFLPSSKPVPVAANTVFAPVAAHVSLPASAPLAPAPTPAADEPVPLADTGLLPDPRYGFVNAKRLTVRERPAADAPVTATVAASSLSEYSFVSILDTDGLFLNVSYEPMGGEKGPSFEGWVAYGDVVPSSTALLLDAATGETRAVLPLAEDPDSVRFSADGRRALLLGHGAGCGESVGGSVLFEVDASDLSIVRTVRVPRGDSSAEIVAAYYDPDTGALRVAIVEWEQWRLSIGRVDETGAIFELREICTGVQRMEVAADGHVAAVFLRNDEPSDETLRVQVVDLDRSKIRNTFTVGQEVGPLYAYRVSLSADGAELIGLTDDTLVSVDTRTGRARAISRIKVPDSSYLAMAGGAENGGSRLVTATSYTDEGEPSIVRNYWIRLGASSSGDRRIAMTSETASARFGINALGTRLFGLDERGAVTTVATIARPDLTGKLPAGERPMVFGFTATPDARYVIVLVGIPSGC